jgi:hypothetical protein
VDPKKIEEMKDCPRPTTLKILQGFLGLTGYYRKFVYNYGNFLASFTALLKKKSFNWNATIDQALYELKYAMCTTPILALLDFTKTFILEFCALGKGIEAFLM